MHCVCVWQGGLCVSVLSIVRGKYDLWSLLMRRMKHLSSSDTERLAMCRLIPVDLSLSVDEWKFEKSEVDAVIVELCTFGFITHDFNSRQSCHVVQTKNQDLRISRTTSQRLGPKGQRPDGQCLIMNCEGISSQRTDEDTKHSFRNTYYYN